MIHSSFYQFCAISNPDEFASQLRDWAQKLLGCIIVAPEGINGMVAGEATALDAFEKQLSGRFADMAFKQSACKTAPFKRLRVMCKPEIVQLGVAGVDARQTGRNVSPSEWQSLIRRDDVVLLDNRNSFEFRLGRFKNAIDPGVTHFRDFPKYVETHAEEWKAAGKTVAMYCTGGIRCEKTSAWMKQFDIPVVQLEGGILNFFKQMPDAEHDWDGECFVFDNRVALDTKLQETATTVETVYADEPEWRLRRAQELARSE